MRVENVTVSRSSPVFGEGMEGIKGKALLTARTMAQSPRHSESYSNWISWYLAETLSEPMMQFRNVGNTGRTQA